MALPQSWPEWLRRQSPGKMETARETGFGGGKRVLGRGPGRAKLQSQMYAQDTTQLEQQVVFLDQLKKCFRIIDMHLENIVANEDAEELDDSASSMVTGLNLVRLAAGDLRENKNALQGGKAELAKFIIKCEEKYNQAEDERKAKVIRIVGAVQTHIGCVLNGGNVPVMQVNGLDAASRNDAKLANTAMEFVALGVHREGDLRRDIRANASVYTKKVEEAARMGAKFDETFNLEFNESSQSVLQGDMIKLTPFANETHAEAQESLRRMLKGKDQHRESLMDLDGDEDVGEWDTKECPVEDGPNLVIGRGAVMGMILDANGSPPSGSTKMSVDVQGLGTFTGLSYEIPAFSRGKISVEIQAMAVSSVDVDNLNKLIDVMVSASLKEQQREWSRGHACADLGWLGFLTGGVSLRYGETKEFMRSLGLSEENIRTIIDRMSALADKMSRVQLELNVDNSAHDYSVSGSLQLYTIGGHIKSGKIQKPYRLLANAGTADGAPAKGKIIPLR